MYSFQIPLFESWEDVNDKIKDIQDNLSSYVPPFTYADYTTDADKKNDGSGDYSVWIEYNEAPLDTITKLNDSEFYNKMIEHFNVWVTENKFELYDIEILSTHNSISYSITMATGTRKLKRATGRR